MTYRIKYESLFTVQGKYENMKIGLEMDSDNINKDFPQMVQTVYGLKEQAELEENKRIQGVARQRKIQELESQLDYLKSHETPALTLDETQ
jgi:hypothetical protein